MQRRAGAGNGGKYKKQELVIPAGFEPATIGLEGRCSIQLSYGTVVQRLQHSVCRKLRLATRTNASSYRYGHSGNCLNRIWIWLMVF